jgi:hypothetical protein
MRILELSIKELSVKPPEESIWDLVACHTHSTMTSICQSGI